MLVGRLQRATHARSRSAPAPLRPGAPVAPPGTTRTPTPYCRVSRFARYSHSHSPCLFWFDLDRGFVATCFFFAVNHLLPCSVWVLGAIKSRIVGGAAATRGAFLHLNKAKLLAANFLGTLNQTSGVVAPWLAFLQSQKMIYVILSPFATLSIAMKHVRSMAISR